MFRRLSCVCLFAALFVAPRVMAKPPDLPASIERGEPTPPNSEMIQAVLQAQSGWQGPVGGPMPPGYAVVPAPAPTPLMPPYPPGMMPGGPPMPGMPGMPPMPGMPMMPGMPPMMPGMAPMMPGMPGMPMMPPPLTPAPTDANKSLFTEILRSLQPTFGLLRCGAACDAPSCATPPAPGCGVLPCGMPGPMCPVPPGAMGMMPPTPIACPCPIMMAPPAPPEQHGSFTIGIGFSPTGLTASFEMTHFGSIIDCLHELMPSEHKHRHKHYIAAPKAARAFWECFPLIHQGDPLSACMPEPSYCVEECLPAPVVNVPSPCTAAPETPTCPYLIQKSKGCDGTERIGIDFNLKFEDTVEGNLKKIETAEKLVKKARHLCHQGKVYEAIDCLEKANALCPGSRQEAKANAVLAEVFAKIYSEATPTAEPVKKTDDEEQESNGNPDMIPWDCWPFDAFPKSGDHGVKSTEEERVRDLIEKTEKLRKIESFWKDFQTVEKSDKSVKEDEIEKILEKPVSMNLEAKPLRMAIEDIASWWGVNICFDMAALDEDGIDLNYGVTMKVEDVSGKSALRLLLMSVDLDFVIKDETIVITTKPRSVHGMVTTTYPIGDILDNDLACFPGLSISGKSRRAKAVGIVKLVSSTINPKSWYEMGGAGTIEYFPASQYLVIMQTPDNQGEIMDLLTSIRRQLWDCEVKDVEETVTKLLEGCHHSMALGHPVKAAHLARKAFVLNPGMVMADPLVYKLHLLQTWHKKPAEHPIDSGACIHHLSGECTRGLGCPTVKLEVCLPSVDPGMVGALDTVLQKPDMAMGCCEVEPVCKSACKNSGGCCEVNSKPCCAGGKCCADGTCCCSKDGKCSCAKAKCCCEDGKCTCKDGKGCGKAECKCATPEDCQAVGDSQMWCELCEKLCAGCCHEINVGSDGVRFICDIDLGSIHYRVGYDVGHWDLMVLPTASVDEY